MLARLSVFAGLVALCAVMIPDLVDRYLVGTADESSAVADQPLPVSIPVAGRKSVVLPTGDDGHFYGTFSINGRKLPGLVDTGASVIAINVSMARQLGIAVGNLDFNAQVGTANGMVKAARIALDRVDIGPISVRDVEAVVLPDASLTGMLVGMSFLNKLSSYRVDNRALYLVR